VMLDTIGPELLIMNKSEHSISLHEQSLVTLTPDQDKQATPESLPINFSGLSKAVKKGDEIFIGEYLFSGKETTSVRLEVSEVKDEDVICLIKNSAVLAGPLHTLHVSQIRIDLPTLTEKDKEVIGTWGVRNNIDFLSLSYTRSAKEVMHAREFLSTLAELKHVQIFAKIENVEGLTHFDEILKEADGIILSRGNLGIDLPPQKVFLYQKEALSKCNIAGKPVVVTRFVDSMTENLRPTRAEATDVANAVLDGTDAVLLGGETLRGLYPVETIATIRRICFEAKKVYNQGLFFKKSIKSTVKPMMHMESIASTAVRAATNVKASVIICFTCSGRTARLIAKYRPTMPVLSIVVPQVNDDQLQGTVTGSFEARQSLVVRGLFPILAGPPTSTGEKTKGATDEFILKLGLEHGKRVGLVRRNDRVVVCQKIRDAAVVEIIELRD
ncbi:pyruvate kinase, partial [Genlisea aurea]